MRMRLPIMHTRAAANAAAHSAYTKYPDTLGIVFTQAKAIEWIRQLIRVVKVHYCLHVDGKHKIHYGKWIVVTIGVHVVEWYDADKVANP